MKFHRPEVRRTPADGFTLVEMMMSMLAAAVLALVMGAMMFYATTWWKRTLVSVDMQRDMRASMDTLARLTRAATNMTFSTGLVFTANFRGRPPATVYAVTSNLFYDPNTSVAGDAVRLVNGSLQAFNVGLSGTTDQTAVVVMVMQTPYESISNRVVLYRRN